MPLTYDLDKISEYWVQGHICNDHETWTLIITPYAESIHWDAGREMWSYPGPDHRQYCHKLGTAKAEVEAMVRQRLNIRLGKATELLRMFPTWKAPDNG